MLDALLHFTGTPHEKALRRTPAPQVDVVGLQADPFRPVPRSVRDLAARAGAQIQVREGGLGRSLQSVANCGGSAERKV